MASFLAGGWPNGNSARAVITAALHRKTPPELAFMFTGQGLEYAGMGAQLYRTQPTFRQTIDQCVALLKPYGKAPLAQVLFGEEATRLAEPWYARVGLFALEYGLAELWRSWGIQPGYLMAHGVGVY